MLAGMILSIPLSVFTSKNGARARKLGLFLTPKGSRRRRNWSRSGQTESP